MKKNKKAMALLIVTIMILIMLAMVIGILSFMDLSSRAAGDQFRKTQLLWSAEAGVNHLYHNLRYRTLAQLQQASTATAVGNGDSITINGCKVRLTATFLNYVEKTWCLSATATNQAGRSCTVFIDSIKASNITEYGEAYKGNMAGTSAFTGQRNADGTITSNTDHFRGKIYFGGFFAIDGEPWFEGNVVCPAKFKQGNSYYSYKSKYGDGEVDNNVYKSRAEGGNVDNYYQNGKSDWLASSDYKYGIFDHALQTSYTGTDAEKMTERYNQIFRNGNYVNKDEPINFDKSVLTWNQLNTYAATPSATVKPVKVTLTGSGEVQVQLYVDAQGTHARINGAGHSNTVINVNNNGAVANNIIIIDNSSNGNKVKILESAYNTDVSIAVKKGMVGIAGDIYPINLKNSSGYSNDNNKDYTDLTFNEITGTQDYVNDARNMLGNKPSWGKFGLLNYEGDVLITQDNSSNSVGYNNKALLIAGAIYAPNGEFGLARTSDDLGYDGIPISKYEKDWFGNYQLIKECMVSKKWFKNGLQVVTLGSVIVNRKAYYKSGTTGIAHQVNSDLRFVKGSPPPGYVAAVTTDANGNDKVGFKNEMLQWRIVWN